MNETGQECPGSAFVKEAAMNLSVPYLVWGGLFGLIGMAFFMYGKKQGAFIPLFVGIALMVYPYFVTNIPLLIVIGIVLIAIPYFVRD